MALRHAGIFTLPPIVLKTGHLEHKTGFVQFQRNNSVHSGPLLARVPRVQRHPSISSNYSKTPSNTVKCIFEIQCCSKQCCWGFIYMYCGVKLKMNQCSWGFMLCSEMYRVPQTLEGNSILVTTERNPSYVHIATPKVRLKITINTCFEEYVIKSVKNRFNLRNFKKYQFTQTQIFKYP